MSIIAKNRRATFDYKLKDKFTAGLILTGAEAKSVKAGNVSLGGSFVSLKADEAWLTNAYIAPYQKKAGLDTRRARKLLLNQRELNALAAAKQTGLHIIPIVLKTQRGFIKVDIATGMIVRKKDKRQQLREREIGREIRH